MTKKTDHERYLESYPHYQVDINNPTVDGYGGSSVVTHYAWTDQDEKACIAYGEDGKLKLHADKDIEICAGASKPAGGVDILVHAAKGDIKIHADENGNLTLIGNNISITASKSMDIKGGDKITMEANDIEFRGNTIRGNEICGNMAPLPFLGGVFSGTKVGADKLSGAIDKFASGGIPAELTSALDSVDTDALKGKISGAQEKLSGELGNIAENFSGLGF
tara:strand:+ start:245 stop:907 length:663 start_codon:yes stop_codon:yes gene_type:complete